MRGSLVFIFLFYFGVSGAVSSVVDTKHGKVAGKELKTINGVSYYGFMGIPYAKPPLDDLRFLPPQPVEPWSNVLETKNEKPACVQFNQNLRKGSPFGNYGSEDCLYLDVFTPNLNGNQPVLVFIYNELFKNSYNKTKDYAPDFFIEEDLVVVTLSHRLTVFGFLSLEDEVLDGNSGLKDIVASLEWVKNNIQSLGGDPDKITLMGALGGGGAVDLLLHTNAKKLFHSAIIQSGSSRHPAFLQENARDRAFNLAAALDRASSSSKIALQDLQSMTVEDLLKKELDVTSKDYSKEEQKPVVPFGPIIERNYQGLVTKYPEDVNSINIPIMIGFNSGEGIGSAFQYMVEPRYMSFLNKDFPMQMPIRLPFKFDPFDDEYYTASDEIKEFYFPKPDQINSKNVPEYINYLGDVGVSYSVDKTAKAYSNTSKVFYYYFDYESKLNENKESMMRVSTFIEVPGAGIGGELCYLFKCPNLAKEYKKESDQLRLQKKMVHLWANFAKHGNPTPEGDELLENLIWNPYTNESQEYLHIANEIQMKSNLLSDRFQFWDNFIEKWNKKAVLGVIRRIRDEL